MKQMNSPFTHEEVKELPKGFNPTTTYLGTRKNADGKVEQVFAPNREQRREPIQKCSPKRNPFHGKFIRRWQGSSDKDGNFKLIGHYGLN